MSLLGRPRVGKSWFDCARGRVSPLQLSHELGRWSVFGIDFEDRSQIRLRLVRSPEREEGRIEDVPSGAYADLVTPSQEAEAQEAGERLERAFDELPEQYQEVITLSRIVGLRFDEIAEQMGRSPGAVRTLLGRALARLSELHGR